MGAGEWSSAAKFFPAVCGGVSDRIWDTVLSYAEKRDRESYFSGCAQKGCPLAVQAYWYSGNRLRDPYTGRGVSILSRAKAETFFDPQKDLVRYVPYRSLGETDGLLPVTDVDVLILTDAKGEYRVEKIAIGIANEGLLEDKGYDLILHASLL